MRKTVAIVQSSYIPWKGYFDLIAMSDEMILLDDVQFTRRDWRNRNLIRTPNGTTWLTVPVETKGKYHCLIKDIFIADDRWAYKHWRSIQHNYAKAPFYSEYEDSLADLYLNCRETNLSEINLRFLEYFKNALGITTPIKFSMDFDCSTDRVERLLNLCQVTGATEYLSGPSARTYLESDTSFAENGITIKYMDYSGYKEYSQLYKPLIHEVSVLDLLLNTGPEARNYMKFTLAK